MRVDAVPRQCVCFFHIFFTPAKQSAASGVSECVRRVACGIRRGAFSTAPSIPMYMQHTACFIFHARYLLLCVCVYSAGGCGLTIYHGIVVVSQRSCVHTAKFCLLRGRRRRRVRSLNLIIIFASHEPQSLTDRAATELAPLELAEVKCAADAELLAALHSL